VTSLGCDRSVSSVAKDSHEARRAEGEDGRSRAARRRACHASIGQEMTVAMTPMQP
jgi:hypothetical protein